MTAELANRVTGHAGNPPGQGPVMKIHLHVLNGIVREASYETYPCPGCHACGKGVVELVSGKNLGEAGRVTHPTLVNRVGPLPKHRQICYGLAVLALADALRRLDEDWERR